MENFSVDVPGIPVSVNVSRFKGDCGVCEYHLSLSPLKAGSFDVQADRLYRSYLHTLDVLGLARGTAVFRRFFCSDLPNQSALLEKLPFSNPADAGDCCAVSLVCQPPGPFAKVSLWAYHVSGSPDAGKKMRKDDSFSPAGGGLTHYWTAGVTCTSADTAYDQTMGIFDKYDSFLRDRGISLADNVVRTWFFIQNIDVNYHGFVAARKEFFSSHGLTEKTHFIASTGVQGTHSDVNVKVTMDAYAVSGMSPEQVRFLAAPEHLSATSVYGVTFERGTSVSYRDRRHVIISGTASIDSKGNILYPGDVMRQLERTVENMEALLEQSGATLKDMASFIAYVRDPADYTPVCRRMRERFGDIPISACWAPVCRPGWLVEVEGMAVVPASNPGLPAFQ